MVNTRGGQFGLAVLHGAGRSQPEVSEPRQDHTASCGRTTAYATPFSRGHPFGGKYRWAQSGRAPSAGSSSLRAVSGTTRADSPGRRPPKRIRSSGHIGTRGRSGAALLVFPESDIGSDAFFMTEPMGDYSQGVVLEGNNLLGCVNLAVFVAPHRRPARGSSCGARVTGLASNVGHDEPQEGRPLGFALGLVELGRISPLKRQRKTRLGFKFAARGRGPSSSFPGTRCPSSHSCG